ncbi:MAG: bifunctional methionine sulfoxide reductase B/A protein [Candidatus Gracilibacteria bacterium]
MDRSKYNPLTEEERYIIEDKGTEAPYSGEYEEFFQQGTYICKRCNTPLYRSKDKFKSGCGWPSFDDSISGRVTETTDADGRRTEITCTTCGAHLGHVFKGEGFTEKDTRHCVNSLSMKFIPEKLNDAEEETATLGGGCFWCVEGTLSLLKGVLKVESGYSGGKRENPSYDQVSTGATGHVEVAQVTFDPRIINFRQLLEVFFTIHDPTTLDRQGNDIGTQYASAIFYHSSEQKETALEVIQELNDQDIWVAPIVTKVLPLEKFWKAEEYHQEYFKNNASQPYCKIVIDPKVKKLREKWKDWLKDS